MASSHHVADTTDIKAKLARLSIRKKRELAASIVANFDELFWITDFTSNAKVVQDGIEVQDVATTDITTRLLGDIIGDDVTADTLMEDEDMNDDDVEDDDVEDDHVEHSLAEVDEADGDSLDVATMHEHDKSDDTHETNVDLIEIADHVLVCDTGAVGLSPDHRDDRFRDTIADGAEADTILDLVVDHKLFIGIRKTHKKVHINQRARIRDLIPVG